MDIELKHCSCDDDKNIMTIATQSLLFKRENEKLPTDTSSSRFGQTITDAELEKQQFGRIKKKKNRQNNIFPMNVWQSWADNRNATLQTYWRSIPLRLC